MQLPHRLWLGALLVPVLFAGVAVLLRPAHSVESPDGQVLFAVRGDEIVLSGTTSDDAERSRILEAVRFRAPAKRLTDVLTLGARVPVDPSQVGAFVGAVLDNGVHDFTGVIHNGRLTASARIADPARAGLLSDALRSVAGELRVDEDFTIGPAGVVGDLDVRALNDSLQRMVADGIRFAPGATGWEGDSAALAGRVGRLLRVAPRTIVTLVSHGTSHELAKARATMVRDVLAGQGVSPALIETTVQVDPAGDSRQVDVLVR